MKIGILGGGNCHALTFARHFAESGIDCFGIGRAPAKASPLWLAPAGYRYYIAHLGNNLEAAMSILDSERPDVVICIAAQGESAASFEADAWMYYQTNCVALVRMVEELRKRTWLKRFIQISTSELYGSMPYAGAATEDSPLLPTSPYAVSKAAFDQHLEVMHRVHGFPAIVVRPSNAYCQGQQLHRIIPRAVVAAAHGKRIPLQGGGRVSKSYLHTVDIAIALELLISKGVDGEVYNVGPENAVTITHLIDEIADLAGVPRGFFTTEAPPRVGEDARYAIRSNKIRALGWAPQVGLRQGICRMLSWARAFPELATMPDQFEIRP